MMLSNHIWKQRAECWSRAAFAGSLTSLRWSHNRVSKTGDEVIWSSCAGEEKSITSTWGKQTTEGFPAAFTELSTPFQHKDASRGHQGRRPAAAEAGTLRHHLVSLIMPALAFLSAPQSLLPPEHLRQALFSTPAQIFPPKWVFLYSISFPNH